MKKPTLKEMFESLEVLKQLTPAQTYYTKSIYYGAIANFLETCKNSELSENDLTDFWDDCEREIKKFIYEHDLKTRQS